ncbi:MAG: TonB family protein [Opitutaceae bacterium]
MNFRKNQAFWTSVILHLVVLFALLLGIIIEAFKPKEKIHVFEMVEPPSDSAPSDSPPQQEPVADVQPMDLPDLPDFTPIPDPVIPEPTPTVAKVEPAPTPPKPKTMSYQDFLKQNPQKTPKPPQPTRPKPAPKIDINPGKINVPTTHIPSSADRALSSQEQDALRRYGAQINARLNRAWVKPANLAGVRLVVEATFSVDASGRITNVRFNPGSGNATFDASVRAAFAKVTSAGPTPTGQGHTFRMSFKMVD